MRKLRHGFPALAPALSRFAVRKQILVEGIAQSNLYGPTISIDLADRMNEITAEYDKYLQ